MEGMRECLPHSMTERSDGGISIDVYTQMQCDWYNATEGKLTGYDCPKCKNRGSIAAVKDGYQILMECDCMAIRRNRQNVLQSGLQSALQSMTFASYVCTEPWQERAKATAQNFADKQDGRWLYMSGQSGAGKTHLCTAVCGVLLDRGVSVRYEMWRTLYREMQRFDVRDQKFQQISDCDVLYIDDFLKSAAVKPDTEGGKLARPDRDTQKELNTAFEIVNDRYAKNKVTIISSEIFLSDLFSLDAALAGRIRERCGGFVSQISNGNSRNYRLK